MIIETLDYHSNFLLANEKENNDPRYFFELLDKYFELIKNFDHKYDKA
jgi:hypothetical protein